MPLLFDLLGDLVVGFAGAEEERDAPDAGERNDGINDAAEDRGLAAAQPCHKVKLEQADAAPVQRADDGEDQRNTI